MLGKIGVGLRTAGFEECNFKTRFGETFAGPSPRGSGTDYDDIKFLSF